MAGLAMSADGRTGGRGRMRRRGTYRFGRNWRRDGGAGYVGFKPAISPVTAGRREEQREGEAGENSSGWGMERYG